MMHSYNLKHCIFKKEESRVLKGPDLAKAPCDLTIVSRCSSASDDTPLSNLTAAPWDRVAHFEPTKIFEIAI
jgi:hypothetical protein